MKLALVLLAFICPIVVLAQDPTVKLTTCSFGGKSCQGQDKVDVPKGTTVKLVCVGEGSPGPIRILWTQGATAATVRAQSGESEINPTIVADVAFVCTATDGNGRSAKTEIAFKVVDVEPLSVSITECKLVATSASCPTTGSTEVTSGTEVKLVCRSKGGKAPVKVAWMVEGARAVATPAARDGVNEITVTIMSQVTYICMGTDADGKVATIKKTFTIKPAGDFLAVNIIEPFGPSSQDIKKKVGEKVMVVCEGRGAPKLPTDLAFLDVDKAAQTSSTTRTTVKVVMVLTVKAGKQDIKCRGSNGLATGPVTSTIAIVGE